MEQTATGEAKGDVACMSYVMQILTFVGASLVSAPNGPREADRPWFRLSRCKRRMALAHVSGRLRYFDFG
jgi:hypothetical protein